MSSKAELLKEKETELFSYSKKLTENPVLSGFCKDDNFYLKKNDNQTILHYLGCRKEGICEVRQPVIAGNKDGNGQRVWRICYICRKRKQ